MSSDNPQLGGNVFFCRKEDIDTDIFKFQDGVKKMSEIFTDECRETLRNLSSLNSRVITTDMPKNDGTWQQSFTVSCNIVPDKLPPLLFDIEIVRSQLHEGMLTYADAKQVVDVRIEHKPKRIPRKIKKALRTFWRGTRWQNMAEFWRNRNFYTLSARGNLFIGENGECTIQGTSQFKDSRKPNELVMSKEAIDSLSSLLIK